MPTDSRSAESHLSCAHCGNAKRSRWNLCASCFTDLPVDLRREIYDSDGGPDERRRALEHLRRVAATAASSDAPRDDVSRMLRDPDVRQGQPPADAIRLPPNTMPAADGERLILPGGQPARVAGLPPPVHDDPPLTVRTVCNQCNRFGSEGQQPGDRCGQQIPGGTRPCGGPLRYADGRAYSAVIQVTRGMTGGRSRSDICTDIAGSRAQVTPEIRRFVESVCDLLCYLPHQKMFKETD